MAYLRGAAAHAHEMLFGYTTAIIAGFLLTAVRNWTHELTVSGMPLMALVALWVCGRVLVLTPFEVAAAVVNASFPVAVAVAIGIPLVRARNTRNYFFVALLVLLGVLTLAVHAGLQQRIELSAHLSLQLTLDAVLFIMVLMGGRVIPMFTNNAIPAAGATRQPLVERLALGTVILLFVSDALQLHSGLTATILIIGALAHAARLYLWRPWRTGATPLVWILHAAYAWIVLHLALRGVAELDLLAESLAVHALTVGGIGSLTLGMMTRTARGHTGRPLQAGGYEIASYGLVQAAAIVRVMGAALIPGLYLATIQLSGMLWAAAFGLYAVQYWPVLTRPRLDNEPE